MELPIAMLLIAILLPVFSAILLYVINSHAVRNIILILTAVILSLNAIALFAVPDIIFTPAGDLIGKIVTILDFALLLYIVYAGVMRKNLLILLFAVLQIAPLAYFEFVKGMHFTASPTFYVDTLSKVMIVVISFIGSIICAYGFHYIRDHEEHNKPEKSRQGRFLFWTVVFLGAMNGLVASNNLYYIYFFWEFTTVCSYMLIGHDLTKQALANAARALWINSMGGVAFCFALLYLNNYCGHESLSLIYLIKEGGSESIAVLLPVALLCFAGFTKSAQFPFQSWLLGAMVAPTPVSALLHSSTMVKAGVYLILRLMPVLALSTTGKTGLLMGYSIALIGGFTFLAGSILAISQTMGKKVLAYSTIANLGLIIACAGLNTPISLTAAILLIVFHAVSKALLFLCAGTIEHIVWSREIDDMQSLVEKAPLVSIITAGGILTMFLPPFGMLLSKWMAFEALSSTTFAGLGNKAFTMTVEVMLVMIIAMFAFASAATMVFWGKWLGSIIQAHPGLGKKLEKFKPGYLVPLLILFVCAIFMSVGVSRFYSFISASVSNIMAYGASAPMVDANIYMVSLSSTQSGILPMHMGVFPVIILFMLLLGTIIPYYLKKVSKAELSPAYLCGDHTDFENVHSDEYYTASDKKSEIKLSGYYFEKYFGENTLNPYINSTALAFIILMLGIVLGVSIR